MGSRSNLPIDIVNSILLELPVKSLLRFKSSCKSWCCTVDDRHFIKSHLRKSSDHISRQKLLFVDVGHQGGVCQHKIQSTEASVSSDSKVVCLDNLSIMGLCSNLYLKMFSCSGLVLVMSSIPGFRMVLWNPAVQKYKPIPNSLLIQSEKSLKRWFSYPVFGFAYDFVAEDYKVVCVHKNNAEHLRYIVGMYSVKNQSWRTIHSIFPVKSMGWYLYNDSVSLNGVIHRIVHEAKCSIISFDLADEKFIVAPVPSTCGGDLTLHALGDRLCVLATVGKEISIWSLEKDGKTTLLNWNYITKFPTLRSLIEKPNDWRSSGVVKCVKENGNILWRKYDGRFIEYNMRKNEYAEYDLIEVPTFATINVLYVESLASLKIPWE